MVTVAKAAEQKAKAEAKEILAPTQVFVSKQYKVGKTDGELVSKEEVLSVQKFVTEPARVSLELGLTLNLGNYESARLSVSATVPCYKEEMHDAYVFARNWVMEKVASERDAIREKKDTDLI